jgi:O-antigen/teichoic acid export membrane protein
LVSPVAAPMIELFYGKEYLPTASLLIVLIWSEVPIFFAAALGSALIAKNLQRHTPLPALLCAGINILLNLWAIPHYGALGASWATVISYSLGIFYLLFISTTRPLVTQGLGIALWPFLLSLGIALGLARFQAAFWWKLLLASCLYLAGGWVSGMIKKSDIERLQAMFRQGIA